MVWSSKPPRLPCCWAACSVSPEKTGLLFNVEPLFPQYVFALTDHGPDVVGGKVYRSDDFGKPGTWDDVTDRLHGAAQRDTCTGRSCDERGESQLIDCAETVQASECLQVSQLEALFARCWLNASLPAGVMDQEFKDDKSLAGVVDVLFQPEHPERMLFQGAALHNWVSRDFGKTFTKVGGQGLLCCKLALAAVRKDQAPPCN